MQATAEKMIKGVGLSVKLSNAIGFRGASPPKKGLGLDRTVESSSEAGTWEVSENLWLRTKRSNQGLRIIGFRH